MTYAQFVKMCEGYNIEINENVYNKLTIFYNYLIEENEKYNLTAIVDEDEVFVKHFLDSMLGNIFMYENAKVIDIGCGAGFPSMPLKILNPNTSFTLVDSVNKKVNFISLLIDKLKLDKIKTVHSRCEDLAKIPKYRENFDIVVSRAVAPSNVLLEYCVPFLKVGGRLIMYKGKNVDEELEVISNALNKLNCKVIDRIDFFIKEIESNRSFIIVEKLAPTPTIYPRLQNKVRKNPL